MSNDAKKQPVNSGLVKGFLAGVLFSHINKRFIIGTLVGICAGMFVDQNITDIPNVRIIANDWIETFKSATKPKK